MWPEDIQSNINKVSLFNKIQSIPNDLYFRLLVDVLPPGNRCQDLSLITQRFDPEFMFGRNNLAHLFALRGDVDYLKYVIENYPWLIDQPNGLGLTPLTMMTNLSRYKEAPIPPRLIEEELEDGIQISQYEYDYDKVTFEAHQKCLELLQSAKKRPRED
jgi:hypothetical protein